MLSKTLITAVSSTIIVGLGAMYYRYRYPYGRSHSCDKALYIALLNYADKHGGCFPSGQDTPEASLSLLYPSVDAEVLRGKSVPYDRVKEILESGRLLSPETCGWHYVEGLTLRDDPELALFWDKAGLGHNGERLPDGGHIVIFIHGNKRYIPEKDWSSFLAKQRKLLQKRQASKKK